MGIADECMGTFTAAFSFLLGRKGAHSFCIF